MAADFGGGRRGLSANVRVGFVAPGWVRRRSGRAPSWDASSGRWETSRPQPVSGPPTAGPGVSYSVVIRGNHTAVENGGIPACLSLRRRQLSNHLARRNNIRIKGRSIKTMTRTTNRTPSHGTAATMAIDTALAATTSAEIDPLKARRTRVM